MLNSPLRIISLVPSITELLHGLGLSDNVVGITKFCVHPPEWFKTKVRIGGTKNIDIAKIKALSPTLVIANKEENVKEQIEALTEFTKVLVTDVTNLSDALLLIQQIGIATGTTHNASRMIDTIRNDFKQLSAFQINQQLQSIPCAYLIWKDPYMTIGGDTFINHLLLLSGFTNVFIQHSRYPSITLNDISETNCKVIFLSSEPYPFKQLHIDSLQEEFPHLLIQLVDGEMFSWYGSRLLLSARYLKELKESITTQLL